ncbi:MAG: hypothetical protein J1F05_08430 [Muribaculaceae bacterium]|nr:hypothetical protein [Muribaculaceae bacterium]
MKNTLKKALSVLLALAISVNVFSADNKDLKAIMMQLEAAGIDASQVSDLSKIMEQLAAGDATFELEDGLYMMNDPNFEWTLSDDKKAKINFSENGGLVLDSRVSNQVVYSTVELPLSPETDDFTYGATFVARLNENKFVGLLFDFVDSRNFKAIIVNNKVYRYQTVKDGNTSDVKNGLIKLGKKDIIEKLKIKKQGDKLTFEFNNQEITKISKVNVTEPVFGILVFGAFKAECSSFQFKIDNDEGDTEESTTDF